MLTLNFYPFPTLETERLILRKLRPKDAEAVYSYRSNVDAMKHIALPVQRSLEEAKMMIEKVNQMIDENAAIGWGITLKGKDEVIGSVSFHRVDKQHYRAEIGYILQPAHWKQGIISEAVKALLDYGFMNMQLHSVEAHIDPDNTASEKVLQRFHFIREAHFKENYFFNGAFVDTVVYSLLRTSYVKKTA